MISPNVPDGCEISFAQLLSRHGARDPTLFKTGMYNVTISKVQSSVHEFKGDYAFLADYTYTLGADQLTAFGEQEMINSGIEFFHRYQSLAHKYSPFVRAASQERVVESAQKFIQGYREQERLSTGKNLSPNPNRIVVIREGLGSNNTYVLLFCTKPSCLSSAVLVITFVLLSKRIQPTATWGHLLKGYTLRRSFLQSPLV